MKAYSADAALAVPIQGVARRNAVPSGVVDESSLGPDLPEACFAPSWCSSPRSSLPRVLAAGSLVQASRRAAPAHSHRRRPPSAGRRNPSPLLQAPGGAAPWTAGPSIIRCSTPPPAGPPAARGASPGHPALRVERALLCQPSRRASSPRYQRALTPRWGFWVQGPQAPIAPFWSRSNVGAPSFHAAGDAPWVREPARCRRPIG
jgi:hypothetical protein